MKKTLLLLCFLALTTYHVSAQVKGHIISDSAGLKVIRVWGTHYERGFAYGYLCRYDIQSIYENFILPNYGSLLPFARAIIGNPDNFIIDSLFRTEARGLIDGMAAAGYDTSGIKLNDLLAFNFMTDLSGFSGFKTMGWMHCSTLMNWGEATMGTSLGGNPVISHHLDIVSADDSAVINNQVLVIHIPSEAEEVPWLLTGVAGQLVASQAVNFFGMNVFLNSVEGFNAQFLQGYKPITLCLRKAMELRDPNGDGLHNPDDITFLLNENTQGYAAGFIVGTISPNAHAGDSSGGYFAELAPLAPVVTYRGLNYNDQIDGFSLYAANNMIARNDVQMYCQRYLNVSNSIHFNYQGIGIGAAENQSIMCTQSTQAANLQFIQFRPADAMFCIAVMQDEPAFQQGLRCMSTQSLFDFSAVTENPVAGNETFNIYPNPAHNSISVTGTGFCAVRAEISDLSGRSLFSGIIQADHLDISFLDPGIYLITISNETLRSTWYLIKQ